MAAEQRLYVVAIGGNRFVVESSHQNKALLTVLRLFRTAMTSHVCKPQEAFELAAQGVRVIRARDQSTWPNVDDRELDLPIPGTEMNTTINRSQTIWDTA